jgi:TetR/AcrR family transcriptional regulator, cholesterol catabolism regulator
MDHLVNMVRYLMKSKTRKTKRIRRSDTKKRILEKATDLFYEHGFVKASIRDIVKAVGVTNSTVYIHFKNKDEILYSIIEDIGATLLRELHAVCESNDDPVQCLREMIFRQVCLVKDKRKQIKIYLDEQNQLPSPLRNMALKQHRAIYEVYHKKITELVRKSHVRNKIDEAVMTFSVFAMINWAYRWFRESERLSIEEIAEVIIRIFFGGILKKGVLPSEDE